MGGWGKEKTAGGVERGHARHMCEWVCMCTGDRVLQTYRQEEKWGIRGGEVGRNRQEGGWPHGREIWERWADCPSLLCPPKVAQAPRAQILAQTKDLAASQPLQDEDRLSKAAMHPGARRGHFSLRQQQWASACGPCQPGRERQRWGREGRGQPPVQVRGLLPAPLSGARLLCASMQTQDGHWAGLGPLGASAPA